MAAVTLRTFPKEKTMKKSQPKKMKIQLHRETLRTLDAPQLPLVVGAQPITTATLRTCCLPETYYCAV
jgi:hypothetical protein